MDKCAKCERQVDREFIEQVTIGFGPSARTNWFCHQCAIETKLEYYETQYKKAIATLGDLRTENNLFRICMMNLEAMEETAASEMDILNVKSLIQSRRQGWESLSIEACIAWLEIFQKHAEAFASILNKKASLAEIKELNRKRTKESQEEFKKAVEKEKIEKNNGLKGTYSELEKKAILGLMKGPLKLTETAAAKMVKSMEVK